MKQNQVYEILYSEMSDNENATEENIEFITSTPKKKMFQCIHCSNQSHCTDCYVRQDMRKRQRVHFSDDLL